MESSKEKLIRLESPLVKEFEDYQLSDDLEYHEGLPNGDIKYLKQGLKSFQEDIGDYDGQWVEEDYKWRIKNGDCFFTILHKEYDKVIGWLWVGTNVHKTWDKNGCPVYNTPSTLPINKPIESSRIEMNSRQCYGYNIWIHREYYGKGTSHHLGFNHMRKKGFKYMLFDIELWNKRALQFGLKSLHDGGMGANIVDLLQK